MDAERWDDTDWDFVTRRSWLVHPSADWKPAAALARILGGRRGNREPGSFPSNPETIGAARIAEHVVSIDCDATPASLRLLATARWAERLPTPELLSAVNLVGQIPRLPYAVGVKIAAHHVGDPDILVGGRVEDLRVTTRYSQYYDGVEGFLGGQRPISGPTCFRDEVLDDSR